MEPNPFLQKLGFANDDRVVILHADDIGMCQASLAAYEELIEFGVLSSAATMVPCPWFPATAVYTRANQSAKPHIDMGVHLTLTSEWNNYRWGPISTGDPATGLLDDEGYLARQVEPVQANADPEAVRVELAAQIERALAAGIDATHIDSHMFAIFCPQFLPIYFELAQKYKLPAFMIRATAVELVEWGYPEELAAENAALLREVEAAGVPLLDSVAWTSLEDHTNKLEKAKESLANLPAGISYFIIHPSVDTPELRAIAPDWRARVADYELFTSEEWRRAVDQSGVKVIGWRAIRDAMRAG